MRLNTFIVILASTIFLTSCGTIVTKPTGRNATDQILSALSIEDSINAMDIGEKVQGKSVKVEVITQGIDKEYIEKNIYAWVRKSKGKLVEDVSTSDFTLQFFVQASGSDREETRWGIPVAIPSIDNNKLSLSRIDFYQNIKQVGRCRLWAYAYDPSGKFLFEQPPIYSAHNAGKVEILGFTIGKDTDIPELEVIEGTIKK